MPLFFEKKHTKTATKVGVTKLTKLRAKYPKLSRAQRLYLDRNVVVVGIILGVYVMLMVCIFGISQSIQGGLTPDTLEEEHLLELSLGGWTLCYVYPEEITRVGATLVLLT